MGHLKLYCQISPLQVVSLNAILRNANIQFSPTLPFLLFIWSDIFPRFLLLVFSRRAQIT